MVLVVEGGVGTLQTVLSGVKNGFVTVVVAGSGRAADAIALALKGELDPAQHTSEFRSPQRIEQLKEIAQRGRDLIKIFDILDGSSKSQRLDELIMTSILSSYSLLSTS